MSTESVTGGITGLAFSVESLGHSPGSFTIRVRQGERWTIVSSPRSFNFHALGELVEYGLAQLAEQEGEQ